MTSSLERFASQSVQSFQKGEFLPPEWLIGRFVLQKVDGKHRVNAINERIVIRDRTLKADSS